MVGCHGWNPHSEGAYHDCHYEPSSSEKAKVAGKAKTRKGTTAFAQRKLRKGKMRKLMPGTLPFILPKKQSNGRSRSSPRIMHGAPRIVNIASPPATDATQAANRD
jgi:hypothetical protein